MSKQEIRSLFDFILEMKIQRKWEIIGRGVKNILELRESPGFGIFLFHQFRKLQI